MINPLGASWKPKIAAILTAIGYPGILMFLTRVCHMAENDALVLSGMAFSVLVALGLATAKQDGVSNSPTPLATAQAVVPVTSPSVIVQPVPLAHPVPVISPIVTLLKEP